MRCLRCFCDAPIGFRNAVWAAAPPGFFREHRAPKPLPDNPDAASAIHPFVLVVDDDRDDVATALRVISSLGYGVAYARDGREALQAAVIYRPELVLTDALMAGVEGTLASELKSARKPPKIVIMGAMGCRPKPRCEAADDFVRKPLTVPRLRRALRAALAHREAIAKDVR